MTVTNDTYITATEVCALLRQLAALNLGVPLTVVLDNARYQRCAQVVTLAASLQIELCFLPPYSPNLNLIERLVEVRQKAVSLLHVLRGLRRVQNRHWSVLSPNADHASDSFGLAVNLTLSAFCKSAILPRVKYNV